MSKTARPLPHKPLRDDVIIEVARAKKMSGSIHIPESAQGRTQVKYGIVVAVGHGRFTDEGVFIENMIKVGSIVMYQGEWQGCEFEHDGKEYRILENEHCAAMIHSIDDVDIPDQLA